MRPPAGKRFPGSEGRDRVLRGPPQRIRCAGAADLPTDADFLRAIGMGTWRWRRAEARFPYRFIGTLHNFPTGLPVENSRVPGCEPLDTLLATRNYGSANTMR
jgi:hypothetical protein